VHAHTQITLWDLSLEKDAEADALRRDVADVPAQLLFIHQAGDSPHYLVSPLALTTRTSLRAKRRSRNCTGTGSCRVCC
jgi:hypothetical protein